MATDQLNFISSYTSKLLRKNFGRGPRSCHSVAANEHLIIYIRGFISPVEEVLLREGSTAFHVEKARTFIIESLVKEIEGVVKVSLDREVKEHFQDWNFPNNSGIIMLVLDEPINGDQPPATPFDVQLLESEIARISQIVQKVPDQIVTYVLSPHYCLVERRGILIPIEKALIAKGFSFELKRTKDELEKSYFHRQGHFEHIFAATVKDIFIDWDFALDKSLMAFIIG